MLLTHGTLSSTVDVSFVCLLLEAMLVRGSAVIGSENFMKTCKLYSLKSRSINNFIRDLIVLV